MHNSDNSDKIIEQHARSAQRTYAAQRTRCGLCSSKEHPAQPAQPAQRDRPGPARPGPADPDRANFGPVSGSLLIHARRANERVNQVLIVRCTHTGALTQ